MGALPRRPLRHLAGRLPGGGPAEAGVSLVEVLVAVAILGITAVTLLTGMSTAAVTSGRHRVTVNADTVVRGYSEAIKRYVQAGGYTNCAVPTDYSTANVAFAAPAGYPVSIDAISYQKLIGLNIVLVLDRSESIAQSAESSALAKQAAKGFLEALRGTGARISLVSFGTWAAVNQAPTADIDVLKAAVDALDYNPYVEGEPYTEFQLTNWDDGLVKAKSQADLFPATSDRRVFFVTDGNPTAWINDAGGPYAGLKSPFLGDSPDRSLSDALPRAAAIEAAGARVFAVGVKPAEGWGAMNADNLKQISGPAEWTPGAGVEGTDWARVQNFGELIPALAGLANDLADTAFLPACPATDRGAQLLTVTAGSPEGRSETIQLVVRRPT